jgi:hypothetical protein
MVRTAGLETRTKEGDEVGAKTARFFIVFQVAGTPSLLPVWAAQLTMIACVRYSVATTARRVDFDHPACRRLTMKTGTRLSSPTLSAIAVNAQALTIELLRRAISSARRAMRSNYPCNRQHHTRRSCARKVGPNTQQVPDVRVRLRVAPPEGIWCDVFKLPDGHTERTAG